MAATQKGFAIINAAPESDTVLSIGARGSAFPIALTEGAVEATIQKACSTPGSA
ncbi:hypothetical protein OG754_08990 [Streptomyces decoyicus]|uniref:hypothetical protein n=1 Tax=Streptomyces decoyicus TaxID=249567 RepID=UPI002E30F73B|nr:hypothetical protein [Streptomyces decoyicus]